MRDLRGGSGLAPGFRIVPGAPSEGGVRELGWPEGDDRDQVEISWTAGAPRVTRLLAAIGSPCGRRVGAVHERPHERRRDFRVDRVAVGAQASHAGAGLRYEGKGLHDDPS